MSYAIGLSGLKTASTKIDVISNNIANASTVGFKAGQLYFSQVLASSQSSSTVSAGSFGVGTPRVLPQFAQGTMNATNNPLDLAINGDGFFRLRDGESTVYTRDGQFVLDGEGFIGASSGARLQGFAVDDSGAVATAVPIDLQLTNTTMPPKATTTATLKVNLDERKPLGNPAAFNPADAATYQSATSIPVHDALGGEHMVSLYFVKSSATQWDVFGVSNGAQLGTGALQTVSFMPDGQLNVAASPQPVSLTLPTTTPLTFNLDLSGTTAVSKGFTIMDTTDNGSASGFLVGYKVDSAGFIIGTFSNGTTRQIAQIPLATFNNTQGLRPVGSNGFAATGESGAAKLGPTSTGAGAIQSGALENSNIDMTNELVRMIEAQRIFQANTQSIKAQDMMLQAVTNL